jgi:hypothetical protein
MHQFVHRVEQLNAYIVQMPCFYNSPSTNATTILANVLFTEAEPGSHVLWMCPIQWQDQYYLHKRGMTLLDMHLLPTYLEAIECIIQESFQQGWEKQQVTQYETYGQSPKESLHQEALQSMQEAWGCVHYTTHNTRDCCKYNKDGKEKSNFCAAKKAGQNFTQLSKKLDRLEKTLKKLSKSSKKRCYKGSDSNSE